MKNKTMRIATVLLALTLVTSCFVGGTFAKYVTGSGDFTDSARVAKFGVTATATAEDLFNDSYKDVATTYTANEEGDTITVQAETENIDIFAPGTEGSEENAIVITGTPEVDVEVTYNATVTFTGWTLEDDSFYCPLKFTVNGVAVTPGADAAEYATNLQNAITGLSKTYDTNTNLATQANNTVAIAWEWDFDDNGAGTNDVKDTYLGDQAAAGNPSTVSIKYGATVTQID